MIRLWGILRTQLAKRFVFYDCSLCSVERKTHPQQPPCFKRAVLSLLTPIPRNNFAPGSRPSESMQEREHARVQPFCPACYLLSPHLLPGCLPGKPVIRSHGLSCSAILKVWWGHSFQLQAIPAIERFVTATSFDEVQGGQTREVEDIKNL